MLLSMRTYASGMRSRKMFQRWERNAVQETILPGRGPAWLSREMIENVKMPLYVAHEGELLIDARWNVVRSGDF